MMVICLVLKHCMNLGLRKAGSIDCSEIPLPSLVVSSVLCIPQPHSVFSPCPPHSRTISIQTAQEKLNTLKKNKSLLPSSHV